MVRYRIPRIRMKLSRYLHVGLLSTLVFMLFIFMGVNQLRPLSMNKKSVQSSFTSTYSKTSSMKTFTKSLKYRKPKNPTVMKDVWQVVKENGANKDIYLYSAYVDDRDSIGDKTIRVMGIIETIPQALYCLLWHSNISETTKIQAERTKAGPWFNIQGRKFQGEIFSCSIAKGGKTPEYVSIMQSDDPDPSAYLKIQVPDKPATPIEIGVCIYSPNAELHPFQIIEWMELLKLWGVAEVTMYNNSINGKAMEVIDYYVENREIVLHPITIVIDNEENQAEEILESVILNDCLYRNMYRYRALISMDFSELIVPRNAYDYFGLLADLQKKQPSQHPAASYMFRNAYFFLDLPPEKGPDFLVTQKYKYRVSIDDFGVGGKSIVSPLACITLFKETCRQLVPKYDTAGWLIDVNIESAINQRYQYCHLDDYFNEPGLCRNRTATLYKDDTMDNFAEPLVQSTTAILLRLNLDEAIFGEKIDDKLEPIKIKNSKNDPNGTSIDANFEGQANDPEVIKTLRKNTDRVLEMVGKLNGNAASDI